MNFGKKRRMCITVYMDSVNYQLVVLALVSTCVFPGSLGLALCCSHSCTVLAECLGWPFNDSDWEFDHFSTLSACYCGSSHMQPLRQMCWFRCRGANLRGTWRWDWRRICASSTAAQFYCLTQALLKCLPSLWKTK